jgi:putative ABC transport system ATP-binding protein
MLNIKIFLEATMNSIETIWLIKEYGHGDTAVRALDGVSIRILPGEFVAVMGPSGCGKSTLLHLVGGLDQPSSGKVKVSGIDLSALNDKEMTELRLKKIGFIFQFFNLIPVLSGIENAALPLVLAGVKPAQANKKAVEWLQKAGIYERRNHRPDQLSGGQQQRVAVARALASEPDLILADEPTGNLDTKAGDEIAALLRQAAKEWGRTVLMVTHDTHIAAFADRIISLKDGKVVERNVPPSKILKFLTGHEPVLEQVAS